MKTKIIPFDLETAKKIQTGEIKGRIVAKDSRKIRVMTLDAKHYDEQGYTPILVLVKLPDKSEVPVWYREDGTHLGYISQRLVIELPEETPRHEFKVGDKVKFVGSEKIVEIINIEGEYAKLIDPKDTDSIVYAGRLDTLHPLILKHELKPFDKVLVRNEGGEWTTNLFSHYTGLRNYAYKAVWGSWMQCIPYKGNEHLVGKTDKPKED